MTLIEKLKLLFDRYHTLPFNETRNLITEHHKQVIQELEKKSFEVQRLEFSTDEPDIIAVKLSDIKKALGVSDDQ